MLNPLKSKHLREMTKSAETRRIAFRYNASLAFGAFQRRSTIFRRGGGALEKMEKML
jgi:hypothetical protein